MKKSRFVAMILGTIGGIFAAIGMCMCLIEAWNAFRPGIVFGAIGIVILLITFGVWRKMTHQAKIHLTGKTVVTALIAVAGALLLGGGMSLIMVYSNLMLGMILGMCGIILLLSLIPMIKGIHA